MERTIRIANTKTQQRYTLTTSATTLGELQDQMTAQGIDFTGMSFTEGLSKTQLIGRDSLLPTNVMFKGQPTNDLVMLLTNTTKNIASGAINRKEAFSLIKQMGLQDAILEGEGKNYTLVKTDVLEGYINLTRGAVDSLVEPEPAQCAEPEKKVNSKTAPHPEFVELLYLGAKYMSKMNLLYADDLAVLSDLTCELANRLKVEQPGISDDDIDDLIANI